MVPQEGRPSPREWHRPCLSVSAAANITPTAAYKKNEKVSIRFNCSRSGSIAAESERSGTLGLLPSLLWWLPPCLLASVLAWRLLVWRVLASWLLVRRSGGRRGPLLTIVATAKCEESRQPADEELLS